MMLNATLGNEQALFDLPEDVSDFVTTALASSSDVSGGISRPLDQDPTNNPAAWEQWLENEAIDPESWREYEIDLTEEDQQYTITDHKTIVDINGEESFLVFIHDYEADVEVEVVAGESGSPFGGFGGPGGSTSGGNTDSTVETTVYSVTSTILSVDTEEQRDAILAVPTNIDATTFEKYVVVDYENTLVFTDLAESTGEIRSYEVTSTHDYEVDLNWYDTDVWAQYESSGERTHVKPVVYDVSISADYEGEHNFAGVLVQRNNGFISTVFEDHNIDGSVSEMLSMRSNNVNWYFLDEALLDEGFVGHLSISNDTVTSSSNQFDYLGSGSIDTTPFGFQSVDGSGNSYDPSTYTETSSGDYSISATPIVETIYSLETENEGTVVTLEGSLYATPVAVVSGDYEASISISSDEDGLTTIETDYSGTDGFNTVGSSTISNQFGDEFTRTEEEYSEVYFQNTVETESGISGFTINDRTMTATVDAANDNAVTQDGSIQTATTISENYSRSNTEFGIDARGAYGIWNDPDSDATQKAVSDEQILFMQSLAFMFPDQAEKNKLTDAAVTGNSNPDLPPEATDWTNSYYTSKGTISTSHEEVLVPALDENNELVASAGSSLSFYEDGSVRATSFNRAETEFESLSGSDFNSSNIITVDKLRQENGSRVDSSSSSRSSSDISGSALNSFSLTNLYTPGDDDSSTEDDTFETTGYVLSTSRTDLNHIQNGGGSIVSSKSIRSSGEAAGDTSVGTEIANGGWEKSESLSMFNETDTIENGYMNDSVRIQFAPDSTKLTSGSDGNISIQTVGGGTQTGSYEAFKIFSFGSEGSDSSGETGGDSGGSGTSGDGSGTNEGTTSGDSPNSGGTDSGGDSDNGNGDSSYSSTSFESYEFSTPFLTVGSENSAWGSQLEYTVTDLDGDSSNNSGSSSSSGNTGSGSSTDGGPGTGSGGGFGGGGFGGGGTTGGGGTSSDGGNGNDSSGDPETDPANVYTWDENGIRHEISGYTNATSDFHYDLNHIEPEMSGAQGSSINMSSGGASYSSNRASSFEGTPGHTNWSSSGDTNFYSQYRNDGLYSEGLIYSANDYQYAENFIGERSNNSNSSRNGSSSSSSTAGNSLSNTWDNFATNTIVTLHGQTTTHEDWEPVQQADTTDTDGSSDSEPAEKGDLLVTVSTFASGDNGRSLSDASITNNNSTRPAGWSTAQDSISTSVSDSIEFTSSDTTKAYDGGFTDLFSYSDGEAGSTFSTSGSGNFESHYHYDLDDGDYVNVDSDGNYSKSTDVNSFTEFGSELSGEKHGSDWLSASGSKSDSTDVTGSATFNRSSNTHAYGVRNGEAFSDSYGSSLTSSDNFEDGINNSSTASVDDDGKLVWTDSTDRTHEYWGAYDNVTSGDVPEQAGNPYHPEGDDGSDDSQTGNGDSTGDESGSGDSTDSDSSNQESPTNGEYSGSSGVGSGFDRGGFNTFRYTSEFSAVPPMPIGFPSTGDSSDDDESDSGSSNLSSGASSGDSGENGDGENEGGNTENGDDGSESNGGSIATTAAVKLVDATQRAAMWMRITGGYMRAWSASVDNIAENTTPYMKNGGGLAKSTVRFATSNIGHVGGTLEDVGNGDGDQATFRQFGFAVEAFKSSTPVQWSMRYQEPAMFHKLERFTARMRMDNPDLVDSFDAGSYDGPIIEAAVLEAATLTAWPSELTAVKGVVNIADDLIVDSRHALSAVGDSAGQSTRRLVLRDDLVQGGKNRVIYLSLIHI